MLDALPTREVSQPTPFLVEYSICTLATNFSEYQQMIASFVSKGFTQFDCEFLYIDNSEGIRFDAFSGSNLFLQVSNGKYVILCNQDIVLMHDGRAELDKLLLDLTRHDFNWAVCGNAGATASGHYAVRITDSCGNNTREGGPFPSRVVSVDENFLVVRRKANLALSRDLTDNHWFGSDICIIADILGWTSYVIDFHLRHKGGETTRAQFKVARQRLRKKYARAFRSRWLHVFNRDAVYLSASPIKRNLIGTVSKSQQVMSRLYQYLRQL